MAKIIDYIKENENIKIRLSKMASNDPNECLSETIYEGMLYDIPRKYHEEDGLNAGWLLGANVHQLCISDCDKSTKEKNMKYETTLLEKVIDDLYDNDDEFVKAYDIVQNKLMKSKLGYGLNTIIERADLYIQNK